MQKTEDIEGKIFVIVVFSVWQRLYEGIFVVLNFFPQIFSKYLVFCGIGITNAELYERAQLEIRRNQVRRSSHGADVS